PTTACYTLSLHDALPICGALKNVVALACGLAQGLSVGDNTRAAVMTRGLAELTRLGVAMGGRPSTFAGLAGMGDLVARASAPTADRKSTRLNSSHVAISY